MGNSNSGRRPQPTALKVFRGNPGQRKLNDREPEPPPGGEVVKPELSAGASAIWDEIAPICLHMRTLTVADVKAFKTLCELQASLDRATALKGVGEWDAAMKLEKDYAPMLRPYYALFGLDPSSRSKLHVPKVPKEPESKWAGLIK